MKGTRALDAIRGSEWAIVPAELEKIEAIALGEGEDLQALETRLGRPLRNTRTVVMRDNVAVIPIAGPIFRYANVFVEVSGATSTEILAKDITTAVEDSNVKAIVLNIDSPGGQVQGINELGKVIVDAAARKPVVAYAGGMMASAAYWLGSAASQIVADETAALGSIGVVATYRKSREDGYVQIVSDQSPKKNMPVETESGLAEAKRIINELAAIFVRTVAQNRGVSEETVLKDFGAGGMLLAESAVAVGMADRVGTLDGVITELQRSAAEPLKRRIAAESRKGATHMSDVAKPAAEAPAKTDTAPTAPSPAPAAPAVDAAAVAAEARKAERERVSAIIGCEEAKGREGLAQHFAANTDLTVDQAKAALAAAPKTSSEKANPLEQAMSGVKNPEVGAASAGKSDEDETLAFIRANSAKQEGRA